MLYNGLQRVTACLRRVSGVYGSSGVQMRISWTPLVAQVDLCLYA